MRRIRSILIANRGEIALRIIKTAKKLKIKTYVILTPQEPNAQYVQEADVVIDSSDRILLAPVFLDVEYLTEVCLKHKIKAIHPGYGFLSENAYFAQRCEALGINFIGPTADAIYKMGNKRLARELALKLNIPIAMGSNEVITNIGNAKKWADTIGYPVILKAAAGGGGKGMRIVRREDELEVMLRLARNEALAAFNDASMIMERYIENPRHVEFQIIADKHKNVIHLFERECSIQRKHQKLLEEAPSSGLTESMRNEMGAVAIKIASAVNYCSAGTVEFLIDDKMNYYFMEMNTRIQVEHPVTETITGLDLIELQILVAEGKKLPIKQSDVTIKGWAIEFRVNAEDVQSDFAPNMGIIEKMEFPNHPALRLDTGFSSGTVIPSCYDSMIAKIIVSGKNRTEAIENAKEILEGSYIKGIKTTIPFFKAVLNNPVFLSGNFTTSFIQNDMGLMYYQEENEELAAAFLAMQLYIAELQEIDAVPTSGKNISPWLQTKRLKSF